MLVWVSSSAFFSNDITHTFLFCLHLVAAALFLSRNFRRRSSGSSSTTRRRRPLLGGGDCSVCVGCICWVAGDICNMGRKVSALSVRRSPSNQTARKPLNNLHLGLSNLLHLFPIWQLPQKTTSGWATCPVSWAVGVRVTRVSEWLGWFTSLPTLLKRCQEAVFHRPLPLRLTPPQSHF